VCIVPNKKRKIKEIIKYKILFQRIPLCSSAAQSLVRHACIDQSVRKKRKINNNNNQQKQNACSADAIW
jgi:hypothetical protein